MKRSIGYSILVLLMAIPSCTNTSGGLGLIGDYVNKHTTMDMELHTNPTDPALVKITDADGLQLTYYGDKDIDGNPLNIKSLSALYPEDTKPYVVTYGEPGTDQPCRVVTPIGTVFEFDLLPDLNMRVKVIWPDGEYRISLPVKIDTSGSYPLNSSQDGIENIRESVKPEAVVEYVKPVEPSRLKNTTGQLSFQIKQCGALVNNATVTITTNPALGQSGMPANFIGDGTYSISVPQDNQADAKAIDKCQAFADKIKKLCGAYTVASMISSDDQVICGSLTLAIFSSFPNMTQKSKDLVTKVCPKVIKLVPKLCEMNDNDDILKSCLKAKLLNQIPSTASYTYTLSVTVPGFGTETSAPVAFDPEQSVGYQWDMGGKFAITDLSTSPSDPVASEGYTATAMIVCPMPSGTPVTISIVGSDGYSNSNAATMKQSGTISLYVPGAKQGVQDIITVEAVIDGITYTDKTSIVF